MIRVASFAVVAVMAMAMAAVDAEYYYRPFYTPLGPWGIEYSVVNAGLTGAGDTDTDLEEVTNASRKTRKDHQDAAKETKNEVGADDYDKAEEAVFHAVEVVENTVARAIDDEVETLFPHRKVQEK